MKKTIVIDEKEYLMASSAFTQFAYRDLTGRSLLSDLNSLQELDLDDSNNLTNVIEMILDISYIMVKEADDKQYQTKEDFIKSISRLFENMEWIEKVVTLAIMPLSGNVQKNQ